MPFSIRQAKADNKKAMRKYTALGEKIFLDALKEQAKIPFDPTVMQKAYVEFYKIVFVDAGKRGYSQLREMERTKDFSFDGIFLSTWREWIGQYVLSNLGWKISIVNENTRLKIQEILAQAIELGLNPFQTGKLLLETIGSRSRARAIAITESTTANNMGLRRSADDFQKVTGLNMFKLWIHSGNPREPRISHIAEQGKPIPKDKPFRIEGVLLDSPGNAVEGQDRKAVARQVINCGCAVSYVSEGYARKKFPKAFEGVPVGFT